MALKFSLCAATAVVLCTLAVAVVNCQVEEDSAMLQMFDAMQQLMTGEPEFDRLIFQELRDCMVTFDPLLTASQDSAWQGIINYWIMNGTESDPWGGMDLVYIEKNVTTSDFLNMTVYEPCNYASNVAYIHPPLELCKQVAAGTIFNLPEVYINAIGKAFVSLVMGSSFMHLSHTNVGGQQDTWSIRVLSYLIHQGSISNLPASSIVRDFSPTYRNLTSLELAEEFQKMYLNLPVEEWHEHTATFDIPDYYVSFAGIFSNVMTLLFTPEFVDHWAPIFMSAFGLQAEYQEFIMDQYLPEIRYLTENITLGIIEETRFFEDGITTVLKLIYAFLWQEEILTDNPFFLNETVNGIGYEYLPIVNTRLNEINSYDYFNLDFQNGTDVYPGDFWCNPVIPHAKWHLESALGLLDLTYLADEMFVLLSP